MSPLTTTLVRDAVDCATLFSTFDAVNRTPDAAQFRFRAQNRWRSQTHKRSQMIDYFEIDELHAPDACTAEETAHRTDQDDKLTAAECVVYALASTLTAGVVNIAAARGVALAEVTSTVEGDLDLNGVLGLDRPVGNGFERVHVRFEVEGERRSPAAA